MKRQGLSTPAVILFAAALFTPRLIANLTGTHFPKAKFTKGLFSATMWANACRFATVIAVGLNDGLVIVGIVFLPAKHAVTPFCYANSVVNTLLSISAML